MQGGDHREFSDTAAEQAFQEGNRLAQQDRLGEAEAAYEQAAKAGHPAAAAYAGLFAESRGEFGQAEDLYRQADDGGDGFGAFRYGLLLSGRNQWDAAKDAWARADQRGQEQPPFDPEPLIHPEVALAGEAVRMEGQRGAFANPVLIGAVTVLVAIVGVFLAYNANNGLPFVPTRELKVEIPNGVGLLVGNEVLAGGYRVGAVSDMYPVRLSNGQVGAQVVLQLSTANGRVPVDSTATISPRSVLGLKYVELHYGVSKQVIPDGGTLPAAQTSVPVQYDDINKIFDAKTRPAVQANLRGFGDVLAGRGSSLNDTIAALPALLKVLTPVARYLSDPRTELSRFFVALNGFFGTISPVAQVNARLFGDQATTFEAISRSAIDLENTIRFSPPTLTVSTDSFKFQQPFLVDLKRFSDAFAPATASLRQALPILNPALAAGIKVLPRTPSVNVKLKGVFVALKNLALDPGTNIAVNGLHQTVTTLNPTIRYLGPYVTVCNGWNYLWANLADVVSEGTTLGNAQRALIMFANHQTNNVGAQGATAPANGYTNGAQDQFWKAQSGGADAEYLHLSNYGSAVNNQGNADCENAQRGYPLILNHLDPKKRAFQTDAHTPGNQGPYYRGLAHVPAGETFSRNPSTGPQLPFIPQNP